MPSPPQGETSGGARGRAPARERGAAADSDLEDRAHAEGVGPDRSSWPRRCRRRSRVGTNASWQKFPSWHPLYGNGGRRLHAGRDARPRSRRACRTRRATARESGRKTISISSEHAVPAQQHPRLRALRRRRPGDRGRRGSDAAVAHRRDHAADHAGEEDGDRRRAARASRPRTRTAQHQGDRGRPLRMGRQPGAACRGCCRGAGATDQERRLGDRLGPPVHRRLAAAAAEPSTSRGATTATAAGSASATTRRRRSAAALGHKKAGRLSDRHLRRRRPELRPGRAVDGRASQDPRAAGRAQQPRVPRRGHDRAAPDGRARPRRQQGDHIGNAITDPNINYAQMAKAYGMYSEGPIDNPKRPGRRLPARAREGARGRARARSTSCRSRADGADHECVYLAIAVLVASSAIARRAGTGSAGGADRRRETRQGTVRIVAALLCVPRVRWPDGFAAARADGTAAGRVSSRTCGSRRDGACRRLRRRPSAIWWTCTRTFVRLRPRRPPWTACRCSRPSPSGARRRISVYLMPSVPSWRRTRWAAWQRRAGLVQLEHRVEDLAVVTLPRRRLQIAGVLHRVLRQLDRIVDFLVLPVHERRGERGFHRGGGALERHVVLRAGAGFLDLFSGRAHCLHRVADVVHCFLVGLGRLLVGPQRQRQHRGRECGGQLLCAWQSPSWLMP